MLITRPFAVEDFSGGITDNYIACAPNQYEQGDNFFITDNRKLRVRPGEAIFDAVNYLPNFLVANARTNALLVFEDQIFEVQGRKCYFNKPSVGYAELEGPSTNDCLPAGTTASVLSFTEWNKQLFVTSDAFGSVMKVYKDSAGVFQVRTAGLPAILAPVVTKGAAGAASYVYAFAYYYTYTVGTVTFEDFGATALVQIEAAALPSANPVNITVIPVISNGATDNYDTANIKVKIYRTQDGGDTFYYVKEVTNGTTSTTDNATDATISAGVVLYTDGGVLDNDPPPQAKFLVTANDIVWYAHIKEGTEVFSNRIRQSNKFDPDSCPEDFVEEVEGEITGLGTVGIYPIVFCNNRIYRFEGFYDFLGRGVIDKREVSGTVGCISARSIVKTREGLFFAGQDGFYFTDGFQVLKISEQLNETYKTITATAIQRARITGVYEPINNRVWWAVQNDTTSGDNDGAMVLDLRWGLTERMTFTTVSGGTSFAPSAIAYFDGSIVRADRRGYLMRFQDVLTTDQRVDVLANPVNWEKQTIIYNYISGATPFSSTEVRKWVPWITITSQNISNTSMMIYSENDDSQIEVPLKEVRFRSNLTWGDSTLTWRDETLLWNYNKLIEVKRRFPAGGLRCSYKQVRFTNALTIIERSDSLAAAVVNANTLVITLNTVDPSIVWPSDVVDYFIYFEFDSYGEGYQIVTRDSNTKLTVTDPGNILLPFDGSNGKWIIRGYKRGDLQHLLSYNIMWAPLSASQDSFDPGEVGGNAS